MRAWKEAILELSMASFLWDRQVVKLSCIPQNQLSNLMKTFFLLLASRSSMMLHSSPAVNWAPVRQLSLNLKKAMCPEAYCENHLVEFEQCCYRPSQAVAVYKRELGKVSGRSLAPRSSLPNAPYSPVYVWIATRHPPETIET